MVAVVVVMVAALENVRVVARGCALLLVKVDAVQAVIQGVEPHAAAVVEGVVLIGKISML